MTKKRKLSDLVAAETQRPEPNPETTEPESDTEPQPKYLTLVRKETRLTELQGSEFWKFASSLDKLNPHELGNELSSLIT